jgi:hypothetical protein
MFTETVPLVSDDGHNPTRRLSEIEKAVNGTLDEDADTYSPEYMKCGVVPEPQFEPTSAPHTPQLCHVERSENLSDEVDDEENASTALMVESNEESNVDAEAGADEVNSYVLAAVDDASDTLSDDSDAVSMSSSEVETHVEAHVNDVSASPVTTEPEDVTQSFTDLSVYAHANLFDEEPYALAGLNTNSGSIPLQDTDSFSTSNGSYCPVAFSVV